MAVASCCLIAAAAGRPLNKFVREIMDEPLHDGEYAFSTQESGWVYIGLDAQHFPTEVYLDGGKLPILRFRSDEPSETMRQVDAGTHRLEVRRAPARGRLVVRHVKTYRICARSVRRWMTDVSVPGEGGLCYEFCRRWMFPAFNTFVMGDKWNVSAENDLFNDNLKGRGKALVKTAGADDGLQPMPVPDVAACIAGEEDVKCVCDAFLRHLATENAGKDVGGLDLAALDCDEETARWIARLVRHYGIEGRTDSLAERFGFTKRLGLSAEGAAVRVTGLVPGRCYTFACRDGETADGEVEWIPELAITLPGLHRQVFRAKADTATFARPAAGVKVRPYYLEDDTELEMLRTMSTKLADAAVERRILSRLDGAACVEGRVGVIWGGPREILVSKPDYAVYVPRQPNDRRHADPSKRGDSFNDHFQVLDDPARGLLHAFWTQATKEMDMDQHIAYSKSSDGGLTWTEPALLAGSETHRYPRLLASWQQPMLAKSGRLYCLWNQQTTSLGPHKGQIFGSFSDDAGETWSPPKLVPFPHRSELDPADPQTPPSWCNWQRPLRLGKGGRFLVGSSRHGRPPGAQYTRTRVEFWRFENIDDNPKVEDIRISCFSTDGQALDVDKVDGGGERLYNTNDPAVEEAGIVKLPDGRLFAMCRSSLGYPVWCVSADGGETWSQPKILRERDGGRPFLHHRSPCPIYDRKGPEAGSGFYFALVHDAFDFNAPRAYQTRGPLYLLAGRFDPKAEQPISFERRTLFSPRFIGNSYYTSYTCVNGKGVLWYNDRKFFLLGRIMTDDR